MGCASRHPWRNEAGPVIRYSTGSRQAPHTQSHEARRYPQVHGQKAVTYHLFLEADNLTKLVTEAA